MSAETSSSSAIDYSRLRIPGVVFETLGYLILVAGAILAFLIGWLTINAAVFLTVFLLSSLIVLSWVHLGRGRHPVFLFLCTLLLFQGGRLVAFCLGGIRDPLRIVLMVPNPFSASREVAATVLLLLSVSALCVYAPCRWNYRPLPAPSSPGVLKYLSYLYLIYFVTLPFTLYKYYLYYRYTETHGGYLAFFSDFDQLVAGIPFAVRGMALLTLPVLLAIFVIETRKTLLYVTVILFFCCNLFLLLTGSRMKLFGLVLTLWYVARIKSNKPARFWPLVVIAVVLIVAGNIVNTMRNGEELERRTALDPVGFITTQGVSLAVTEVAVMHPETFRSHVLTYLLYELEIDFTAADVSNYFPGRQFGYDVGVFLNPVLFSQGVAPAGAYIGEAYVMGGVLGVVFISLMIGIGVRFLYHSSGNPKLLVLVALVLPQIFLLPRGFLLGWASSLLRAFVLLVPLAVGWSFYDFIVSSFTPRASGRTQ